MTLQYHQPKTKLKLYLTKHKRNQKIYILEQPSGLVTAKLEGKRVGLPQGSKLITKKEKEAKEIILKHSKSFNGTLNAESQQEFQEIVTTNIRKN